MTEQKLQEIKKEKLDDIYIDDKEITKKNYFVHLTLWLIILQHLAAESPIGEK